MAEEQKNSSTKAEEQSTDLSFEEYRERMQKQRAAAGKEPHALSVKQLLAIVFGIFMVIVYIGMGYLMMTNFFMWDERWTWVRYGVGIILCVYGVYRGVRIYKEMMKTEEEE